MSKARIRCLAVAGLSLVLAPLTAKAQECFGGWGAQFGPAYSVKAQTYALGECSLARVESIAWIQGWSGFLPCASGSAFEGGKCQKVTFGQSEAIADFDATLMCNRWSAKAQSVIRHRDTFQVVLFKFKENSGSIGGNRCLRAEPEECLEWEIYEPGVGCVPYNSPILVPLTRSQDYHLTSVGDGVMFDFESDGVPERMAWTARNSRLAFLAMDTDGDGKITSGRELVGDRLAPGQQNGWDALTSLAPPEATALHEGHEVFQRLLLWEDRNHDGVSQASELQPASNLLSEIGLGYVPYKRRDGHGNKFMFQGWASVRTAPGRNPTASHEDMLQRNIKLYDVFFRRQ